MQPSIGPQTGPAQHAGAGESRHYLVQLGKKAGTEDWHLSCHSHSHLRQGEAKAVRERHLAPSSCLSSLGKHASRTDGHTAAASTCSAARHSKGCQKSAGPARAAWQAWKAQTRARPSPEASGASYGHSRLQHSTAVDLQPDSLFVHHTRLPPLNSHCALVHGSHMGSP